jgi:hypothetical protein
MKFDNVLKFLGVIITWLLCFIFVVCPAKMLSKEYAHFLAVERPDEAAKIRMV